MRTFCGISVILLLAILPSSALSETIPHEKIRRGSERYHDNGALQRVFLKETVPFDGIQGGGWTWFFEDGRLRQTVLHESHTFGPVTLPKGSTVFLDKKGFLLRSWLVHDMTIEGIPVDGGGKMDTGFHRNGSLRVAFLKESMQIQDFPCRAGKFTPVYFDSTGGLVQCTLKQDHTLRGKTYSAGTTLHLDSEGYVITADSPSWIKRVRRGLVDLVMW